MKASRVASLIPRRCITHMCSTLPRGGSWCMSCPFGEGRESRFDARVVELAGISGANRKSSRPFDSLFSSSPTLRP